MKSFRFSNQGMLVWGIWVFILLGFFELEFVNEYFFEIFKDHEFDMTIYRLFSPMIVMYFIYYIYNNTILDYLLRTREEWIENLVVRKTKFEFLDEDEIVDLIDSTSRQMKWVKTFGNINSLLLISISSQFLLF